MADEQFLQLLKTRGLTLEAYKKQVAESLLITKVVNAEVRSRLTVLDTELQETYRTNNSSIKWQGARRSAISCFFPPMPPSKMNNACVRRRSQSCSNCVMVAVHSFSTAVFRRSLV